MIMQVPGGWDCSLACHRGLRVVIVALEASAPKLTRQEQQRPRWNTDVNVALRAH